MSQPSGRRYLPPDKETTETHLRRRFSFARHNLGAPWIKQEMKEIHADRLVDLFCAIGEMEKITKAVGH